MPCGCNGNANQDLQVWNPPTGKPVLAVYDPVTNLLRPLAWQEEAAGMECCNKTTSCEGVLPSSKQMQDAYFSFHRRLLALEQKYCECICQGGEVPEPAPDIHVVSAAFVPNTEEVPRLVLQLTMSNGQVISANPLPHDIHVDAFSIDGNELSLGLNNSQSWTVTLPVGGTAEPDSWRSDVVFVSY